MPKFLINLVIDANLQTYIDDGIGNDVRRHIFQIHPPSKPDFENCPFRVFRYNKPDFGVS
ncbi:hypothetical protein [Limnofasciculus baicalensis]|uniref:Uncharacterized protein n=1 Tax=Limnofasciculus baicalensis BBK-W-15 TaxID=2699891 RepID=A0AAE3KRJ4_9CYAN|nr:hypothetical protein [Limnofasciculus baicalensis]MCP2728492.1 hypothetical protein [Limnofasciculus baicalensis BBK-W-15]